MCKSQKHIVIIFKRFEENKQLFQDYVQQRTQQNYKFWIVSFPFYTDTLFYIVGVAFLLDSTP